RAPTRRERTTRNGRVPVHLDGDLRLPAVGRVHDRRRCRRAVAGRERVPAHGDVLLLHRPRHSTLPRPAEGYAVKRPSAPDHRMSEVHIRDLDPTSTDATELLAALDAYQSALYPPESTHLLPPADLKPPHGVFLGAFVGARLVGCCGYIVRDGY